MRRSLALLLLLLSFFWQTAAVAGGWAAVADAQDPGHTLLHWQEEAHHHHDGDYHEDSSSEASAHVQLDGALQLSALLNSSAPACAAFEGRTQFGACQLHLPAPPPEQRERPPRA